jgi:hypothetical protein
MPRPVFRTRLFALLAVTLLAGCVTANPFRRHAGSGSADALVDLRNDRWDDLTVYLQREGTLLRLGVVPGKGTATLTVHEDYVRTNGMLRLVARPMGRDLQGASEQFGMGPGSRVTWHIPLTSGESPVAVTSPAGWSFPTPR